MTYADASKDDFGYDAAGHLTSYQNPAAAGTLSYDALGRKTGETVTVGSLTKSFGYRYDAMGNKAAFVSPEGIEHLYSYDKAGKLTQIKFDGQTVDLGYDKTHLKQTTLPGGITTDYSYNGAGWLEGIAATGPSGPVLTRNYGFDAVGNITSRQDRFGATAYAYDPLYQLTGADHPDAAGLPDETYSYDRVGNRLTSADTAGTWSYNQNNELQGQRHHDLTSTTPTGIPSKKPWGQAPLARSQSPGLFPSPPSTTTTPATA